MFNINVDELVEKYGTGFLFRSEIVPHPIAYDIDNTSYFWAYGEGFFKTVDVFDDDDRHEFNSECITMIIKNPHLSFVDNRGEIVPEPFILVNPDDFNKSEPTESPVKDEPFSAYIIDKVFSFGKSVEFYPDGSIVIQGEYEDDHVRFEKTQQGLLREYVECMSRARLIENNVR
jgi:hypothetical protein